MPPVDGRNNNELSESEIRAKVAQRQSKAKRTRNQRIGGYVVGFSGLIFAFVTALILDNTLMAFLGFSMSLVGFGVASLDQVVKLIRSVKGGGSSE
jgi:hypothetical protein